MKYLSRSLLSAVVLSASLLAVTQANAELGPVYQYCMRLAGLQCTNAPNPDKCLEKKEQACADFAQKQCVLVAGSEENCTSL